MKKTLAIHDLSGFGRCSISVVLPILSALKTQCCPLTTAVLSTHTGGFDSFTFCDLTHTMQPALEHYGQLGLNFDAVYSGFLGSAGQIELVERALELKSADGIVLVDPVMGDHGTTYKTYTRQMCEKMAGLVGRADIITPNLTEAAILLGLDYTDVSADERTVKDWLVRLADLGPEYTVITGVAFAPGTLGAAYYCKTTGNFEYAYTPKVLTSFPGTGDIFASVLLGKLLNNFTMAESVKAACEFVYICAKHTEALGTPARDGVCFENFLCNL